MNTMTAKHLLVQSVYALAQPSSLKHLLSKERGRDRVLLNADPNPYETIGRALFGSTYHLPTSADLHDKQAGYLYSVLLQQPSARKLPTPLLSHTADHSCADTQDRLASRAFSYLRRRTNLPIKRVTVSVWRTQGGRDLITTTVDTGITVEQRLASDYDSADTACPLTYSTLPTPLIQILDTSRTEFIAYMCDSQAEPSSDLFIMTFVDRPATLSGFWQPRPMERGKLIPMTALVSRGGRPFDPTAITRLGNGVALHSPGGAVVVTGREYWPFITACSILAVAALATLRQSADEVSAVLESLEMHHNSTHRKPPESDLKTGTRDSLAQTLIQSYTRMALDCDAVLNFRLIIPIWPIEVFHSNLLASVNLREIRAGVLELLGRAEDVAVRIDADQTARSRLKNDMARETLEVLGYGIATLTLVLSFLGTNVREILRKPESPSIFDHTFLLWYILLFCLAVLCGFGIRSALKLIHGRLVRSDGRGRTA